MANISDSGTSGQQNNHHHKLNHTNNNSAAGNGNNGKNRGPGRPKKQAPTACTWCAENKIQLKYVLPTHANEKKEFCSELCITEFRKAYANGGCLQCDNVIRENAPHRDFCSKFCMNEHANKSSSQQPTAAGAQSSTVMPVVLVTALNGSNINVEQSTGSMNNGGGRGGSNDSLTINNNNNSNVENLNESGEERLSPFNRTSNSGLFQLEQLHVFNWEDYLKVKIDLTV